MNSNGLDLRANFIRNTVRQDIAADKNAGSVTTRFPPEPNGYLHIGHAKSICLNFGIAAEFGGYCNLRFDDTNPDKEDEKYQDAIKEDVRWLGFDWGDRLFHASDYFTRLHELAVHLINAGKAYVDSLSAEEIRTYRGTLTSPGKPSPYRDRTIAENLDLFERMRRGEFEGGEHVLRAKIDIASPNINLRDPTLYRIRHTAHHRTGSDWKIYPLYDYTHCISDALEGVTHSLCTLEFEDHRPLYDWVLDQLPLEHHPQQIEFARLELNFTITSKRKLNQLVINNDVDGWDDPRMPTLRGMRRRGYPPAAIRDFCERIGITKKSTLIDIGVLENCVRENLNIHAPRAMAVLNPLKIIITNYPQDKEEMLEALNHPKDERFGTREIPFSNTIYIEQDDFMLDPPKKFFRLAPGREVRLRYAYLLTCDEVVKDPDSDEVIALHCHIDLQSRGGHAPDGRKVKGTIHWVSAKHAARTTVRLYDRLFNIPSPADEEDFRAHLNPQSCKVVAEAMLEPALADVDAGRVYQFERLGYFCAEQEEGKLVFNRTVTLRDTWAKLQK